MKLLSVIVPAYNMEAFLPRCLDSLIAVDATSLARLELIVVNDGSCDQTGEIAHRYEARHPDVVRVIDKPNGHYGSCVNAALAVAAGTFVMVLDADDGVLPAAWSDYLTQLHSMDGQVDLVVHDYQETDAANHVRRIVRSDLPTCRAFALDEVELSSPLVVCADALSHAFVYRTSLLRDMCYRQTEGCAYTDLEWFTLPLGRVRRAAYVPLTVVTYLLGRSGQSMEARRFLESFATVTDIVEQLVERFPQLEREAVTTSRSLFAAKVEALVRIVYEMVLVNRAHVRNGQLLAFDLSVQRNMPRYYPTLDGLVAPSRHFKFRFIREWRQHPTRRTFRFLLLDLYRILVRLVLWARNIDSSLRR